MIRRASATLFVKYRSVTFLSLAVALNSLGMGTIAPVLPLFTAEEYHVNAAQVGIAIGLFGVGRLVISVPSGYLCQIYGRKPVMALGVAVNVLGALMVALSFSYWWLIGWRFVSGLGGSVLNTVATVYLRDESTPQNRGRLLSAQELSILAGQTLGPLLGGYLANVFGLRIPLYAQAIMMALSFAVIVGPLPESRWREPTPAPAHRPSTAGPPPDSTTPSAATPSAATTPSDAAPPSRPPPSPSPGRQRGDFWRMMLSPAFIFVGLFGLMIVANRQGARFSVMPLFGAVKGFGPNHLGLWLSLTHFPQLFSTLTSGYLSDRFGRKSPIIPSLILMCAGIATFVWAGSLWQLLLSGVLMGMGEGLGSPAGTVFFADIAPPGLEGVTIGLFRTFGAIGTVAGAIVLGAIADVAGFPWALWVDAIIFAASGIGVILFVRETYRRRRS